MVQIAIGLYKGYTALDWVGPYQVFSNLPRSEVVICAAERGPVEDDVGIMSVNVDATFTEVGAPDVVFVPGGLVTHRIAAAGRHPVIDWVRRSHRTSTWTTSVCTGSLLLGAAGLLEGVDAATHWRHLDDLEDYGARPVHERVVRRDRIITGAGVSAGIDLALSLAAAEFGDQVAQAVQLGIEYDPQPPFDAGSATRVAPELRDLVDAVMASSADKTEAAIT